jgi:hypothetical protein
VDLNGSLQSRSHHDIWKSWPRKKAAAPGRAEREGPSAKKNAAGLTPAAEGAARVLDSMRVGLISPALGLPAFAVPVGTCGRLRPGVQILAPRFRENPSTPARSSKRQKASSRRSIQVGHCVHLGPRHRNNESGNS